MRQSCASSLLEWVDNTNIQQSKRYKIAIVLVLLGYRIFNRPLKAIEGLAMIVINYALISGVDSGARPVVAVADVLHKGGVSNLTLVTPQSPLEQCGLLLSGSGEGIQRASENYLLPDFPAEIFDDIRQWGTCIEDVSTGQKLLFQPSQIQVQR